MSIIIDVEASGLHPDSYPIEIAWYDIENQESDSFLIRPTSYWYYWDPEAELIHGIDRAQLLSKGVSVFEAGDRLIEGLKGRPVHSDAVAFDKMWIDTLLEASGTSIELEKTGFSNKVHVKSVFELVAEDKIGFLADLLKDAERPHRALEDCRVIGNCILRAS